MPEPVTAGIAAVSSIGSGFIQGNAAKKAGRAQTRAINEGIARQDQSLEAVRRLLGPYAQAGTPALRELMAIAGIGGGTNWDSYLQANPDVAAEWQRIQGEGRFATPQEFAEWHYNTYGRAEGRPVDVTDNAAAQQQAIAGIEGSPIFQTLARQGEDAIMQNASATGGLRGGNTQGALARFRPALLNQFIEQQYGRIAGIAGMGANAAGAIGNAEMGTAGNVADLLVGRGQAQAGAAGAQGQIWSNVLGQIGGGAANFFASRSVPSPAGLAPSAARTMAANPGIF